MYVVFWVICKCTKLCSWYCVYVQNKIGLSKSSILLKRAAVCDSVFRSVIDISCTKKNTDKMIFPVCGTKKSHWKSFVRESGFHLLIYLFLDFSSNTVF